MTINKYRELTGKFYVRHKIFNYYHIMVEVKRKYINPYTFEETEEFIIWEVAKKQDLLTLNIKSL